MLKLFLLAGVVVISLGVCAQEFSTNEVSISKETPLPESWAVYANTPQFRIEYKKASCDPSVGFDFESVVMRFSNLTPNDLYLAWHIDLSYDGACKTCGYDEYERFLTIPANQVIEISCQEQEHQELRLFSRFIDTQYSGRSELTAFRLSSLRIQ